jgi:hypothetical protein
LGTPQNGTSPQSEEYGNAVSEVEDDALLGTVNGSQLVVLKRIIEAMTGKRVLIARTAARNDAPIDTTGAVKSSKNAPPDTNVIARDTNPSTSGWGLSVDVVRTKVESRSSDFSATGTIVTDDGRALQFEVSFVKQSTRIDVERIALREGDAKVKDPLVLLYSGSTAELSKKAAAFDLDDDGTLDQLPGISNGAYVVYDANHDGSVSGAAELLGAKSGNGFVELSALDSDNNGFIDNADSAYQAIRLWDPTKSGESALTSLSAAKIGALYTGQATSPFDIRDSTGNLEGQVRATGIYITEAMDVRPLEQIDLVQRAAPRSIDVKA